MPLPKDGQSFLLSDSAMQAASYATYENFQPPMTVSASELTAWKQRIIRFQAQLRTAPAVQQGSLFEIAGSPAAPDAATLPTADPVSQLDPFDLRRQNTEFWRWQFDDGGVAAMYFVIDYAASAAGDPLLLYVGETIKSNQRWKGEHGCKRYLLNYRQAHYDSGINSELGIAFWPCAPAERRPRQQLEAGLIYRWRSPFNKENWRYWNTPFVGGKQLSS